jgi:RNA polymerase-binding transcription factor DksA
MIHNGFLYCDKCGKPIRLVSGMQFFFDHTYDYCSRCGAEILPKLTLRQQFIEWLVRWIWG